MRMKTRIVPIVAGVALLYFLVMELGIEIQSGSSEWEWLGNILIVVGVVIGFLALLTDIFITRHLSKTRRKLGAALLLANDEKNFGDSGSDASIDRLED